MKSACLEDLELQIRSGWRVIAFESFEEDRALALLRHAAEACQRPLITWSLASGLDGEGRGAGSFDEGLSEVSNQEESAVIVVLDAHRVLHESSALRRLRDLIPQLSQRRQTVVLLGPVIELPLELEREAGRAQLPLPHSNELEPLLRKVAEKRGFKVASEDIWGPAVRGTLGLTAAEAARVFTKGCTRCGGLNEEAVHEIIREKRDALRRTPALSFHEADIDLADIGGLGELKHWLRERRSAFGEDARQFGLPVPRGLLLLGVQGCGKSLSAKAVAREWQFPLLRLDLAAAFGDRERSPEVTIREATQVADSLAPVVLWIDEIEKGFSAASGDSTASRVFGSFLTWLSEKRTPVFVAATANDVANLPPELLRRGRFDELFFVDLPNHTERVEILSIHLAKSGRDPKQFQLEELAAQSERLSGAELEQVVGAALYKAFAEDRDLGDNDLVNAITETVPLYDTYEERIKELRDWARTRARAATLDPKMVDLFASS